MREHTPMVRQAELRPLLDTQRVECDPLLTQASTGNSSAKLDGGGHSYLTYLLRTPARE